MYNPHRGLGPGAPNSTTSRLNELLEGIRAEFENQSRASEGYEHSGKRQLEIRASNLTHI